MTRVRVIAAANAAVLSLRDRMTPGQRWTSALAIGVAVLVLLFGMPLQRVVVVPEVAEADAPDTWPVAPDATYVSAFDGAPTSAPQRRSAPEPMPAVAASEVVASPGPVRLGVTALVSATTDGTRPPGRSEADVARTFVGQATVPVKLLEVEDAEEACRQAADRGALAIAGEGLGAELLACLTNADVAVLAFEQLGLGPPVVSTRRSYEDTLLDLAAWGVASGALTGAVGVATSAEHADEIGRVVAKLEALGVDVVASAAVGSPSEISDGVRDFESRGADTVLFAMPVEAQRQWGAQHRLVDPGVRFVVSDVDDGVQEEAYPPAFDGALAHTALRVPWYERDHEETAEQTVCRQRWEAAASPGRILDATERRWVFSWCQHVALAATLVEGMGSGSDLEAVLEELELPSPLTSDLGALADGGWGPTADAVLTWSASCVCWTEERSFTSR